MITEVHSVAFNQDAGCFVCATNKGFRVYNTDPFKETFCRNFGRAAAAEAAAGAPPTPTPSTTTTTGTSLASVEMLFRCNILALVGGGGGGGGGGGRAGASSSADPAFPPNKVVIWDDHQARAAGELSFRGPVRAVRLRRDAVVVALEHRVLAYSFGDLSLTHSAETLSNPKGLVAVSSQPGAFVLACPGLHSGQVRVEHVDRRQTRFVAAHTGALAALALSRDGKRLATASDKGTLVRVWDTGTGELLQELRRGSDPAAVGSLAISGGCEWLAAASDKGTVHVWALGPAVRSAVVVEGGGGGGSGGAAGGGGNGREGSAAAQQQQPQQAGGGGGGGGGGTDGGGVYGHYGSGDVAGLGSAAAGGAAATAGAAAAASASAAAAAGRGERGAPSAAAAAAPAVVGSPPSGNPTTVLSSVRGLAPILPRYFSSEWSLAQYRVQEPDAGAIVVGFPPPSTPSPSPSSPAGGRAAAPPPPSLVVLTTGGAYHKVTFDPVKGGACVPVAVGRYIADGGDDD
jgi:WD repeat-containing protein 45